MIDLITMIETDLTPDEVAEVIRRGHLQTCTRNGATYYETSKAEKNREHVYMKIETNGKLKIECSLHKLHEKHHTGRYTNYGGFSLPEAAQCAERLLTEKGIPRERLQVTGYEIGLNLNVSQDCRAYMDGMTSIGPPEDNRPLYINPKYKDSRAITTLTHRHVRKFHKVYDKVFEAKDKRRNDAPARNILRIETTYRRVERMSYTEFFSPINIRRMKERFLRDWRTLHFRPQITAPKGTGRMKKELCEAIIRDGAAAVLEAARNDHKAGQLTIREYRTIREFVAREWDRVKQDITISISPEEAEFRTLLRQDENN